LEMKINLRVLFAISLIITLQPLAFGRTAIDEGALAYQKQQYQAAKTQFLRATTSDPTSAAAQYHLANTYVQLGGHQLAQKHYRIASLLDPSGTYGRFAAKALNGYSASTSTAAQHTTGCTPQTTYFTPKYSEERSILYQHGVWQKDDGSGAINLNLPPHTNSPIGGTPSIPGVRRTATYSVNPGGNSHSAFNPGWSYGTVSNGTAVHSTQHSTDRHHDDHHE
jgi:tetratricopeptide (TPR) repeat protein